MKVNRNPFIRLLLCYMMGIILAGTVNNSNKGRFTVYLAVFVAIVIVFIGICRKPGYHTGWISGLMAAVIFIFAGFFNMKIQQQSCITLRKTGGMCSTFLMEIVEPPEVKDRAVNVTALIRGRLSEGTLLKQHQKIAVHVLKDAASVTLKTGDRLIARGTLYNIEHPGNPGEFDYSEYMAARGICNRMFLKQGQWSKTPGRKRMSIRVLSLQFQQKLLRQYQLIGLNKTLFGILSALTLGYKNDLESQTRQMFSRAGVMHVMALSGFNVAVIATMMGFLFFFAGRSYPGKVLKTLLIIVVIWIFAFVTGLSPSVLRAAVMISFVMAGQLLHRKISTYNILCASAFFLLLFSPALIYNVSFQLSFAAVFGIILFQPLFYQRYKLRNKILNYIWQLFTVSCAAQLSTLPVTLFYFHQFPAYFWLTNLYVVPLVSVIICLSVLFLLVSFIHPLMLLMAKILTVLLGVLYKAVAFTEVLPYALLDDLYITKIQCFTMILLILFLGIYLLHKNRVFLMLAMGLFAVLLALNVIKTAEFNRQQLLMVGNLKGSTAIHTIAGRACILVCDPALSTDDQRVRYAFGNFWNRHGVASHLQVLNPVSAFPVSLLRGKRTQKIIGKGSEIPRQLAARSFNSGNCSEETLNTLPVPFYLLPDLSNSLLIHHAGKRIILLRDNVPLDFSGRPLMADVIVITNYLKPDLKAVMRLFRVKMLVIDSSVKRSKAATWENACKMAGIPSWNVVRQGAYLLYSQ